MQKLTIKNRSNKKITVLIEKPLKPKVLVFIMHGFGGFKEQSFLETISKTFLKNQYGVVRFDTTNSIGKSDGKLENATTTNYYQDLEDVIKWAKKQKWYKEPFFLIGHSLGGLCVSLFSAKFPKKIKSLILLSCAVSGKLLFQSEDFKSLMKEWKNRGIREWESKSMPGMVKRSKYDFVEDTLKYDLLELADRITCQTLFIVGDKDITTPLKHVKLLFKKLKVRKELHIIKNADHVFKNKKDLRNLEKIINNWLKNIN